MLKKLLMLLAISIQILILSGCGSVSESGSTSLFQTASVSFTSSTLDSTTSVTAKPNTTDSASNATFTIVVKPYPGFTASSFTVRDLKYTYTQTSGGSAVFSVDGANFSTNLSFSPVLASGYVKDKLIDLGFDPGVTSLAQPWIFNVQTTYTVFEDNSGKSKSYSIPLGTVRFI